MPEKKNVNLGLKNLAMLASYFDYILLHLRQKVRLRPDLNPKFLSTLGPNPARTRPEPDPKSPARLTTLICQVRADCAKVFIELTSNGVRVIGNVIINFES